MSSPSSSLKSTPLSSLASLQTTSPWQVECGCTEHLGLEQIDIAGRARHGKGNYLVLAVGGVNEMGNRQNGLPLIGRLGGRGYERKAILLHGSGKTNKWVRRLRETGLCRK